MKDQHLSDLSYLKNSAPPSRYDEDYFERGLVTGLSSYMNYSWMPELTIRMAHYMALELEFSREDRILDFGCAKGFLVKALRILDYNAYGVDVSNYAIQHADRDISKYCKSISGCDDPILFKMNCDWLIAKDVFEHLSEIELRALLKRFIGNIENIFAAIPLAANDCSNKYISKEYDRDVTHVLAKSMSWWEDLFLEEGWLVVNAENEFPGCKENWTSKHANGNGFFILKNGGPKYRF